MRTFLKLYSGGRRFYLTFPSETDALKVFNLLVAHDDHQLEKVELCRHDFPPKTIFEKK